MAKKTKQESVEVTNDEKKILRTFVQDLPVTLTSDEVKTRGESLAASMDAADRLEFDRKETNDAFKAKIELADGETRKFRTAVSTGKEKRPIECVETISRTGTVEVVRKDTGEIVSSRAATAFERQDEMPFESDDETEITDPEGVAGDEEMPDEDVE